MRVCLCIKSNSWSRHHLKNSFLPSKELAFWILNFDAGIMAFNLLGFLSKQLQAFHTNDRKVDAQLMIKLGLSLAGPRKLWPSGIGLKDKASGISPSTH